MKKLFTVFLAALLCAVHANAQSPVITSSVNPVVGDAFDYNSLDVANVSPGMAGANVTWDFSGISSLGISNTIMEPVANGTYASSVVNANLVAIDGVSGAESYLLANGTQYAIGGAYTGSLANTLDNYSDQREMVKFPITFGDVFNESMDGTHENFTGGFTYSRSGTITIEADGYGTLILPSGSFNDVLRIKVTTDYSDQHAVFPGADYLDVTYLWFKQGENFILMSMSTLDINSITGTKVGWFTTQTAVGTREIPSAITDLKVYPNPSRGISIVQYMLEEPGKVDIALYNLMGQKVKSIASNYLTTGVQSQRLELSDLDKGVYLLQVENDGVISTKRINLL